jgi:activator of 2-hydroxyglutaryl-CoA dehydratase
MANRIALNPEIMMTGGVARNKAVVSALENLLKKNIIIDELAQYTGAIGAALFAG